MYQQQRSCRYRTRHVLVPEPSRNRTARSLKPEFCASVRLCTNGDVTPAILDVESLPEFRLELPTRFPQFQRQLPRYIRLSSPQPDAVGRASLSRFECRES